MVHGALQAARKGRFQAKVELLSRSCGRSCRSLLIVGADDGREPERVAEHMETREPCGVAFLPWARQFHRETCVRATWPDASAGTALRGAVPNGPGRLVRRPDNAAETCAVRRTPVALGLVRGRRKHSGFGRVGRRGERSPNDRDRAHENCEPAGSRYPTQVTNQRNEVHPAHTVSHGATANRNPLYESTCPSRAIYSSTAGRTAAVADSPTTIHTTSRISWQSSAYVLGVVGALVAWRRFVRHL